MLGFFVQNVPHITAEEVRQVLDEDQDVLLLDVRTPDEFAKNRIKGAINVPVDQVEDKIPSVIPNKEKKIYVYCLSSSRSVHAVDMMQKLGYTNVYNLTSGLLAWRAKQFPLE